MATKKKDTTTNLVRDFVLTTVPDGITADGARAFWAGWAKMCELPGEIRWGKNSATLSIIWPPVESEGQGRHRAQALEFAREWIAKIKNDSRTSRYAFAKIRKPDSGGFFSAETYVRPLSVTDPVDGFHGGEIFFAYNDF